MRQQHLHSCRVQTTATPATLPQRENPGQTPAGAALVRGDPHGTRRQHASRSTRSKAAARAASCQAQIECRLAAPPTQRNSKIITTTTACVEHCGTLVDAVRQNGLCGSLLPRPPDHLPRHKNLAPPAARPPSAPQESLRRRRLRHWRRARRAEGRAEGSGRGERRRRSGRRRRRRRQRRGVGVGGAGRDCMPARTRSIGACRAAPRADARARAAPRRAAQLPRRQRHAEAAAEQDPARPRRARCAGAADREGVARARGRK